MYRRSGLARAVGSDAVRATRGAGAGVRGAAAAVRARAARRPRRRACDRAGGAHHARA